MNNNRRRKILFMTREQEFFFIEEQNLKCMELISLILTDIDSLYLKKMFIPLLNISSTILLKIIQFMLHQNRFEQQKIKQCNFFIKEINKTYLWENEFFNIDKVELYQLVLASSYLRIEILLTKFIALITKTITDMSFHKLK